MADDDDHIDELREMLRGMMDASQDPYLDEERKRIVSGLFNKAFPNLHSLKLWGEKEFDRVLSVVVKWVMDTYEDLLEKYPDKRGVS